MGVYAGDKVLHTCMLRYAYQQCLAVPIQMARAIHLLCDKRTVNCSLTSLTRFVNQKPVYIVQYNKAHTLAQRTQFSLA